MQASAHLIDYVLPSFKTKSGLRNVLLVVCGSLLITAASKLSVPVQPVPFTMQSYAILVLAMAMGFRLATATVAFYLAQGAVGIPVFASGTASIASFVGPTGGYLFGFLFAAMAVGYLADKGFDKKLSTSILAMAIGTVVLFVPGVLWLAQLFGMQKALAVGLHPFWFGMTAKLVLGALTLPLAWKWVGRKR